MADPLWLARAFSSGISSGISLGEAYLDARSRRALEEAAGLYGEYEAADPTRPDGGFTPSDRESAAEIEPLDGEDEDEDDEDEDAGDVSGVTFGAEENMGDQITEPVEVTPVTSMPELESDPDPGTDETAALPLESSVTPVSAAQSVLPLNDGEEADTRGRPVGRFGAGALLAPQAETAIPISDEPASAPANRFDEAFGMFEDETAAPAPAEPSVTPDRRFLQTTTAGSAPPEPAGEPAAPAPESPPRQRVGKLIFEKNPETGVFEQVVEASAAEPSASPPASAQVDPRPSEVPPPDTAGPLSGPTSNRGFNIRYELQGKRRSERPMPALIDIVGRAAASTFGEGTTVVLYSGKEPKGTAPVGARYRHPRGYAGDFRIYGPDGNPISIDDKRFPAFLHAAARLGIKGIGAGHEYMGKYGVHLDIMPHSEYPAGYGPVWGSLAKAYRDSLVETMASGAIPDYDAVDYDADTYGGTAASAVQDYGRRPGESRQDYARRRLLDAVQRGRTYQREEEQTDPLGLGRPSMMQPITQAPPTRVRRIQRQEPIYG